MGLNKKVQPPSVAFVSVTPGLVCSIRGITIHPDTYLSQEISLVSDKQQLIILTGGRSCAAQALSDPRTHQLVHHILQQNGYIAVIAQAERFVAETGLLPPEWVMIYP
ncbi:MAG: hypothetical protein DWQ04_32295 [Chloroflexi bacterium]|nr:MAG: hypothetical protein DWQ04_32295 [Chloroflexota bacterium]